MAPTSRPPTPPALVVSVVCGTVGLVLLVVGVVTGSQVVLVSGVAAGAISLVSALVWREQLIDAWNSRKAHPGD